MTWLHLSIPIMAAAALYSAHRGGLCFGVAARLTPATRSSADHDLGLRCWVEGYGYALLTVLLAGGAGFVAGRIL